VRCKGCQYSLLNLAGPPHRCPECGRAFDPEDPRTFTPDYRQAVILSKSIPVIAGVTLMVLWIFFFVTLPDPPANTFESPRFIRAAGAALPCGVFLVPILLIAYKLFKDHRERMSHRE
jgi:hypothetical protein